MSDYRRWLGALVCFVLVSIIFVVLKGESGPDAEYRLRSPSAEISLLLYIVPGFVAASLSRGRRVLNPFLGAVGAMAACEMMRYHFAAHASFWQEAAYGASAVCWCVFGAFIYLFALTCVRRRSLS